MTIKTWQERFKEIGDATYPMGLLMKEEIAELRAELDKLKQQEPVAEVDGTQHSRSMIWLDIAAFDIPLGAKLYLAAGASKP